LFDVAGERANEQTDPGQSGIVVDGVAGSDLNIKNVDIETVGDEVVVNTGQKPQANQNIKVTGISGKNIVYEGGKIVTVGRKVTHK